jgi:hypothetical protein
MMARAAPCKGSALPTELIARTGFPHGNALRAAPLAASETGTQGANMERKGAASPGLSPNRPHSTCCTAMMFAFFAELNRDAALMAQARAAATECERKDA